MRKRLRQRETGRERQREGEEEIRQRERQRDTDRVRERETTRETKRERESNSWGESERIMVVVEARKQLLSILGSKLQTFDHKTSITTTPPPRHLNTHPGGASHK